MATKNDILTTLSASTPSIDTLAQQLDWIQSASAAVPAGAEAMSETYVTRLDAVADTDARLVAPETKLAKEETEAELRELHLAMLKKSLHTAAKLEFATIPPYLCALWSIKNDRHEVANSIREVVQEEMLHLALVCNMLASLGEVPRFNTDVPRFPDELPGGVHPNLVVQLRGYSPQALQAFMRIELPEKPVAIEGDPAIAESKEAETIGRFYTRIERAFDKLRPEIRLDRQIAGPLAYAVITNIDDVHRAVKVIRDQGEGASGLPFDSGPDDFGHYYRFLELGDGHKLTYDVDKKRMIRGKKIGQPECWPMKPTPKGGYKKSRVSEEAWLLISRFDEVYSQTLDLLHEAWTSGGQASFLRAIELMFALESYAKPLMQMPVSSDKKPTLGPCFRYVPEADRRFIEDHKKYREVCHESRQ